jgi:ribosomal protein L37AE/L43A
MTEQGAPPSTVTGTTDKACPGCGETTGVQPITGTSPKVRTWSCTACSTSWAITTVNPQPYLDRLAATVELLGATRSVLRQVIQLSDDAAKLSDSELRDRLMALADRARLVQPA